MPSAAERSDEALAAAAAGGSRDAFEELVDRYGGRVIAILESRLKDYHTALDSAQEAWIRVFRALPRFRPDLDFRPWLFSIVLNLARDEGRRRQRSRVVYTDQFGAAHERDAVVETAAIDAALRLVPEPFRTSLVLVDVEGLGYEAAAASLGCAVGTVKSRVSRGRTAFRDHWERLSRIPAQSTRAGASP